MIFLQSIECSDPVEAKKKKIKNRKIKLNQFLSIICYENYNFIASSHVTWFHFSVSMTQCRDKKKSLFNMLLRI